MAGEREVIFELVQIGRTVKMTTVDTASSIEARFLGDPPVGEPALKRLALQKLTCVLKRQGRQHT